MSKGVIFNDNQGPITVINENKSDRMSIIGTLIEIIATADHEELDLDRIPAEIDVKISFNNLSKFKWLIRDYVNSSLLIDESITELNKTILNGSTKLKRQMRTFYNLALDKYAIATDPFELLKLQSCSDQVVSEVMNLTTNLVKKSSNLQKGYYEEDINYGVALITSYSIIECVVLENPNDHN